MPWETSVNDKVMEGKILADDRIYQPELDIDRPKEIFMFIGDRIAARGDVTPPRILDVGCASGSFLHYLHGRFPEALLSGTDISEILIGRAEELIPSGTFFAGSVDAPNALRKKHYDVTCSVGVLCYFDDIERPLRNLVESVRDGGGPSLLAP